MKNLTRICQVLAFAICLLLQPNYSLAAQSAVKNQAARVEQFSFLIKDFRMDHQSQANNLNLSVRYRYRANISNADYPDFRWIEKDIETFLNIYPNETDYWEILNKKLTSMVMKKYDALDSVTIEIEVSPSSVVPFFRSSTVTRERDVRRKRNILSKTV